MNKSKDCPVIVIIGRPNVGKSSIFNRLFGRKRALVHDKPGVTRDRLEEKVSWNLDHDVYQFKIVDTGGVGGETFAKEIEMQVDIALTSADLILFVVDGQMGLHPGDQEIFRKLKRSQKSVADSLNLAKIPLYLVVNKADLADHDDRINDFYKIGADQVFSVSAEHDRGFNSLKEAILNDLSDSEFSKKSQEKLATDQDEDLQEADKDQALLATTCEPLKIAIVGRPNVGKSTLANALLRKKRMIVSPIAGTTVDSIDVEVTLAGQNFVLIDTAGIRKKSKTEKGIEVLSVVQTRKALERCDVALLLIDGSSGVTDQDEKIGGLIEDVGCGVILCVNKWDLQKKNQEFTKQMAAEWVRKQMPFLKYAPILFMSAVRGKGVEPIADLATQIVEQHRVKVSTRELTEWISTNSKVHNPKNAKFYMSHQISRHPPTFLCHVSDPKKIHFTLHRHLINGLRQTYGFLGNPVRLKFVKGKG